MRGEVSGRDVGALVGVVLELVVGRGWGAVEIGYREVELRGEGEEEEGRRGGGSRGLVWGLRWYEVEGDLVRWGG